MNLENSSVLVRWIQYVSPVRYAGEAYLRNEFDGNEHKYFGVNPIMKLGYDIGFNKCLIYLFCLGCILRVVALLCIRVRISKLQ